VEGVTAFATVVLSCEHASCAVPPGVDLAVDDAVRRGHAGWDEGALAVAEALAAAWGVPLVAGEWSRLVVDLNRREESAEVVPATSFGIPVPGNRDLPRAERERRIREIHRPYRARVRAEVERRLAAAGRCLHLSVHSFSPALDPSRRRFDVGILFDPDRPGERSAAEALLAGLAAAGLAVRANEPYAGVADGLTTWLREETGHPGYSGIEVEVSLALAASRPGREKAIRGLLGAVPAALSD
jgi:predicted N-formylglutamate amidohydrolase